ncbi:endocuticle structural glycoprotein SgAbd-1-like [Pieris rapae]|uniref:endocuticle structural glycoprotein SgAbd-1-like n=1 Tax=Pieris rapae TaxID=64459 RepID=UPI001E27BE1E|nr:endocuticle structural glycoprotein SgAbd-1-like [Pieris rapae]
MSANKMLFTCVFATSLLALVASAGNEYLPPTKGYNYPRPDIPFPTTIINRPTPPPFRPTPPPVRPTPPPQRPTPPPQRPTYIPPGPTPGPSPTPHEHHHEDHEHHEHHHHHEPGMPFDFAYTVNEDGNDYSHNAISDGDITRGQYRVALPDGRTQIVKYTADWKNGFNAEVSYEGEASYPDQPNGIRTGGQAYAPPSQGGGYQY